MSVVSSNGAMELRNTKTPQGTETVIREREHFDIPVLRNTKTPQGTETQFRQTSPRSLFRIEKYEDPAGDGNGMISLLTSKVIH